MNYFSESHKYRIFWTLLITVHILYIFTFLGIVFLNPNYIRLFRIIVQIIICVLLLLRFNPFTRHDITALDKTMIFSSASFLLLNLLFTEIFSTENLYSSILPLSDETAKYLNIT
jgi:hypothetical protein